MTSVLLSHMAETRRRFIRVEKRKPTILAIGRWDARELARYLAAGSSVSGRQLFREARFAYVSGGRVAAEFGGSLVDVRVDGRIGRMPGGLWWQ